MVVTPSLQRQHIDILSSSEDIAPLLNKLRTDNNPELQKKVISQINSLLGKLFVHLSMEDKVLYPYAIDSENRNLSQKAQQLMKEMGNIKNLFVAYRDNFLIKGHIDNPELFVKETNSLLLALKERINREEKELYPLFFEQETAVKA